MEAYQNIAERQIWADPGVSANSRCEGYQLPFPGYVTFNESFTVTLETNAVFQTICTDPAAATSDFANASLPVNALGDPFEASVVPQMFVLGAMLVIAWSLVIILIITPRTTFILGTGVGHLGRPTGNSPTIVSVGGRPWLQKFAAITVGISLVIATINSFRIIEDQYDRGFQNASVVTTQVLNSYEVRIIRVISTTFVWLAQVQTLIRLFPRHREKVLIKWAGFGLIILDTLFVILNNFVSNDGAGPKNVTPRGYTEVIPALSYVFELALNVLYAAWVLYYSFVKRRFAFFHPQMRNIAVVAVLSYCSVLIPVAFFITDIAKPVLSAWGDYIRWVGSAAASVVVWEWVERIEALEREERKNGILGQEIFDGDEFGKGSSLTFKWPRARSRKNGKISSSSSTSRPSGRDGSSESHRTRATGTSRSIQLSNLQPAVTATENAGQPERRRRSLLHTILPPTISSPIPRSDTGSAASTLYAVVRQPPSNTTTPAQDAVVQNPTQPSVPSSEAEPKSPTSGNENESVPLAQPQARTIHFLPGVGNPFKRRRSSPPREVSLTAVDAAGRPSQARWAKSRSPKNLFRLTRPQIPPVDLPIVVIPAQPRGQIWTPPVDSGEERSLDTTRQDPRNGEAGPAHTPLSLDSSHQVTHEQRAGYKSSDRDSPPMVTGRNPNLLGPSSAGMTHGSDRAQSPRSVLERVDEQSEHNAHFGSENGSSSRDRPVG